MASVSSDMEEPNPPPLPPLPAKHAPSSIPAAIAVVLLAVAVCVILARPHSTLPSLSMPWLSPLIPWSSSPSWRSTADPTLDELVSSSIQAHCVAARSPPDYALHANGGRIALGLTSGQSGLLTTRADDPHIAIDDDVRVGKCWKFRTFPFQLGIRLPLLLRLSHVSIEHSPTEMAVDMGQAPRNMTLWGVVEGKSNTEIFRALTPGGGGGGGTPQAPVIARGLVWAPLASFAYDIHDKHPLQSFSVQHPYKDSDLSFGIVALEVHDNWGSDTACLYRFRVHGSPV
ncbi:SUN domain-containing protein 1 [Trametes pubescens]|uniref:SUN domain-containing protein 1 n=1 Tax=Trametes pubescens TaxID=154538 RepID=A0A1M2VJG1_TRAPU|nr:SUN domain-containing protein 1 [Trametes pubescens]